MKNHHISIQILGLLAMVLPLLAVTQTTLAQPINTQNYQHPIRVACVGDSITEGTANADHRTNSWPLILQRLLETQHPTAQWDVQNFGRSGATLLKQSTKPYWDENVYQQAFDFNPDVVVINLGTNDASIRNWDNASNFIPDYLDLVDRFAALPTKPRIYLSNLTPIYPRFDRYVPFLERRAEATYFISQVAAKRNLTVINLITPLLKHPEMFPDGLHPNTAGNGIMAAQVFLALTGKDPTADLTIAKPQTLPDTPTEFIKNGRSINTRSKWTTVEGIIQGTGDVNLLKANTSLGAGPFHLQARLRMTFQENSAAAFVIDGNTFGFEGARGTLFRNGKDLGFRLLFNSPDVFERESWINFEVIRNASNQVWFIINDRIVEMATIPGPIRTIAFDPMRSTMQISDLAIAGDLQPPPPISMEKSTIPLIDLDNETQRQVIVDREPGQYLGHVTTTLLDDGKTILAVYPKGHGRGPIVYKKSADGGLTWSDRLPTPENWATSLEVPTIHKVVDPKTNQRRHVVWSGLYPARLAVSEDEGQSWSELKTVGKRGREWGGIVVMGFVKQLANGSYLAMFHDDGRFFTVQNKRTNPPTFTLYQTFSHDGGLTWTYPQNIWQGQDLHLCEPGIARSPDGKTLAVLLRENSRQKNSHIIFSNDEAQTWSTPKELPSALTGDRHTTKYAHDGRLVITFRDTAAGSPTQGDWVAWVGTYDDLVNGKEGQYRIRLKDNQHRWDTAYPGLELLPDGTFVATTYGHWIENEEPYILSVRFTLDELDKKLVNRQNSE